MDDAPPKTSGTANNATPTESDITAEGDIITEGGITAESDISAESDIIDVTTQNFVADVLEASKQKLVLLDLWAPWCEPCRQLTPLLEKLTQTANGQIRLAKMNIDDYPQVAQQLQVQSIPAIFAFKNGQPVDGFMGVMPESELQQFIEKNLGEKLGRGQTEQLIAAAQNALQSGAIDDAISLFNAALDSTGDNPDALAGLARAYIANDDLEAAAEILARSDKQYGHHAGLAAARAALELAHKTSATTDTDIQALKTQLEADENNHQARFDLALALHAAGDKEAAIAALLDIIRRQRDWQDEAARKQLVELFNAYGAEDDATIAGRRQLSSLLFS